MSIRPLPFTIKPPSFSIPNPVVTSSSNPVIPSPKPVVTPSPKPFVIPSPNPVVIPSPKPVVTPSPKPFVIPSPKPVVTPSPKPVITSPTPTVIPKPVVTSPTVIPKPVVTSPTPTVIPKQVVTPSPKKIQEEISNDCRKCQEKVEQNEKYINLYFGERNGKTIVPIKGINYTLETLAYMTSMAQADRMVKTLIQYYPGPKNEIVVVECCSGLGGDTIALLDSPNIKKVIAHEIDPVRRQLLQNNLNDYGFSNDRYEVRGKFEGFQNEWKGAALYLDPPWMPSSDQCMCDNIMLSGIKVDNKTLEQWMTELIDMVSVIVMKLPPNYKLSKVPGYKCLSFLNKNKNVQTTVCTPISRIPQSIPSKTSQSMPISQISKAIPSKTSQQIIEATPTLFLEDEQKWLNGLQQYIYNVIAPIVFPGESSLPGQTLRVKDPGESSRKGQTFRVKYPSEPTKEILEKRIKLVDADAMRVWVVAFTHKSYRPTAGQNYEVLEKVGDKALGLAFGNYLISKYPDITEEELSVLDTVYMSKVFQAKQASEMRAIEWVRVLVDRSTHIREDLFESIFGALIRIGDTNFTPGSGYILVYNTLVGMFQDKITINFDLVKGSSKTQIKEIAEKMHWTTSGDISQLGKYYRDDNGRYHLTLSLTQAGIDSIQEFLRNPEVNPNGITLTTSVLADVTGPSVAAVEELGYTQALQTLASLGITYEWVQQVAEMQKRNQEGLAELWPAALARMSQDGFVKLEFPKQRKGVAITYIQLIGVNPDGTKEILITIEKQGDISATELMAAALHEYGTRGRDIYG